MTITDEAPSSTALKMSLTSDAALFELLETGAVAENLETIIERSLRIKKAVVEQDEKEQGLRKILNFGHTLGHGYEAAANGALYHGEAVALGMLPMCSDAVRARLLPVLTAIGLPTQARLDPKKVYEAVVHDKKSANGTVSLIRVEVPGQYIIEETELTALEELIRGGHHE